MASLRMTVLALCLLGAVYFLLTSILHKHKHPSHFFAHLMAGLFLYYFLQQALTQAVKSVTSGGKLILNINYDAAKLAPQVANRLAQQIRAELLARVEG